MRLARVLGLVAVIAIGWASDVPAAMRIESVTPSPRTDFDTAAVDELVTAYLEQTGLPGASLVVVRGNQVAYAKGLGHDSSGEPITPDTRMPIASLSKSITAMAVMQLVEAGTVELDQSVVTYLPELRMADERVGRITVRQLLDQTSGMADTKFAAMHAPTAASLRDAVEQLRSAALASDPGARWHYHNPNYQVAARLVEVVSGEPFADYLARHIFTPLGMSTTRAVDTTDAMTGVAPGYIDAWGRSLAMSEPSWFVGGSGGVVTTGRDIARWLMLQASKGSSTAPSVISAASLDIMHTASDPNRHYGLGWGVGSDDAHHAKLSHDGGLFTFTAYQVVIADLGVAVAVMANRGITLGPNDSEAIGRGVLAIARGERATAPRPRWRIVDAALGLATLATLFFAARAIVSARRWGGRGRPLWHLLPSFALVVGAIVTFALLPRLGGSSFGHRDVTLRQMAYVTPATVTLIAAIAVCSVATLVARVIARGLSRKS